MLISKLLCKLYVINSRLLRSFIRWAICKMEGGELYSMGLRKIFENYYGVEVGMYSYGACFMLYRFDRFTTIGRYCSIARTAMGINHNHSMELKSTHAFFFNPVLKCCAENLVEFTPLKIGHDVWMGEGAIILPNVTEIGTGAVIAAGAIVNKNVSPYAIVVGNPARVVRYRFPQEIIDELLASKWWEKDMEEIKPHIKDFQKPYEELYFDKKSAELQNK